MKNKRIKRATALVLVMALLAVLILAGCSTAGNESEEGGVIKIATKPMTEQFILGEMLKLLIEENTDLTVEMTKGVGGGTSNIHPALIAGEFDLYPEYTGTGWSFVLKKEGIPDDETLYAGLTEGYKEEYDLEWVGLYGFNNTYGLVARKDIADQYNLKTYSDLATVSGELTFGAEYDFYEREDGYDALAAAYGLNFKKVTDLDIGLKYNAINSGEIDVMNIFTTDGQLAVSDVVVLEDDKNFYQTYYCGTVVRSDTLEKYPELRDVLMMMDGILTDAEMAALNNEVEAGGADEKDVARNFLTDKGLL